MITHDHKQEVEVLKEQVAALRRQQARSAEMAADVISAFGETYRRAHRLSEDGADASIRVTDSAVLFPLGVKDQHVVLSSSDTMRIVSATALCVEACDVVTLRLESEAGVRIVQLIAGEPTQLLENVPAGESVAFKVRRVGSELCLLRLETASRIVRNRRPPSKGTLWKALQLLRADRADLALEVALGQASDIERRALSLLHATLAVSDEAAWLSHLNDYVGQFDIAPIRLRSGNQPRFMRLDAQPARVVTSGPTVTVIMPVFNAQRTLEFAAKSILNQTWQSLELIIVDDCSDDDSWTIARQLAHADSRVKVHRNPVNVGPYVSKNVALSIAQGKYITCHDADDWAHPQRIEKQVDVMCPDGRAVRASASGFVRMSASGVFNGLTRIGETSHDGALRLAHVSCMFEGDFMRRYLGYWDTARFAADGEMLERVTQILGAEFVELRQLAIFSLDAAGSLTNDPAHGVSKLNGLSSVRRSYRDNWRKWHAGLSLETAYLPFPQLQRRFEAPPECQVPKPLVDLVLESPPAPAEG